MTTHLRWHDYRYYPYERDLARREVLAVLGLGDCEMSEHGVRLPRWVDTEAAKRLTYFSHFGEGDGATPTVQARLEEVARQGRLRQATRYSVHGLHEYKGKFNPQVAKAILNIFNVGHNSRVLDPFCGSGTTLVECAHSGATGVGTDLNPLAVFLANAKLDCLSTPADLLREDFARLSRRLARLRNPRLTRTNTGREHYLRSWFDERQLAWIEAVRSAIESSCDGRAKIFLSVASNLLRDYSDQDPSDLRIRRRNSPLPELGFREAFETACTRFLDQVAAAQLILGVTASPSRAIVSDSRTVESCELGGLFDAAITSPPYATALPYIDTQRLSLVWLGLCEPEEIGPLDGILIGSREMKRREHLNLTRQLQDNARGLPDSQASFCRRLAQAVGSQDGFRRQAVPALIYRYMADMQEGFRAGARLLREGAPYALIVGHNHTVLSGVRRDIDTPSHLVSLAQSAGWVLEEAVPLQTYPRYGLHAVNAVEAETLLILRNGPLERIDQSDVTPLDRPVHSRIDVAGERG
ncbi:MAG: TRM11 family SAM-dependent methyltransferase [Xanthobacteraceae bacterium]